MNRMEEPGTPECSKTDGRPEKKMGKRLFIKVNRKNLPQVKDKYPFLSLLGRGF